MPSHITATRYQQADKIFNVFVDYAKSKNSPSLSKCLDIGCGSGEIITILATKFQIAVGIEVDIKLVNFEKVPENSKPNIYFSQADGANLPFQDESFEFIVCSQVYEHTKNQEGLVREIWRVLRKDGVCFFSGPNKYTIMEEHYFLPFLSWLPPKISDIYVRMFKRNPAYDIYPLSRSGLTKLLSDFVIEDVSFRLIRNPERYGLDNRFGIVRLLQHLPENILKPFLVFIPNFNLILRKR